MKRVCISSLAAVFVFGFALSAQACDKEKSGCGKSAALAAAKVTTEAEKAGGCSKGAKAEEAAVARAMKMLPQMIYKVGELETPCCYTAKKASEETGSPILYMVGDEGYTCKKTAMDKLAGLMKAEMPKLAQVVSSVDGEQVNCFIQASAMASEKNTKVKYLLAGVEFDCRDSASAVAAKVAEKLKADGIACDGKAATASAYCSKTSEPSCCATAKTASAAGCSKSAAEASTASASGCGSKAAEAKTASASDGCCAKSKAAAVAAAAGGCDKSKAEAATASAAEGGCSKSKAATASAAGCDKSKAQAATASAADSGCCKSKAATASAAGCDKSKAEAVAAGAADSGCCKSKAATASAAGCDKSKAQAATASASEGGCSKSKAAAATAAAGGCSKSAGAVAAGAGNKATIADHFAADPAAAESLEETEELARAKQMVRQIVDFVSSQKQS